MARSQIVLVALMFVAVVVIGSVSAAEPPKGAPAKAGAAAAPAKAGAATAPAADTAADAAGLSPSDAKAPSDAGSSDAAGASGGPTAAAGPSGAGGPAGSKTAGASDLKASAIVAAGVAASVFFF